MLAASHTQYQVPHNILKVKPLPLISPKYVPACVKVPPDSERSNYSSLIPLLTETYSPGGADCPLRSK